MNATVEIRQDLSKVRFVQAAVSRDTRTGVAPVPVAAFNPEPFLASIGPGKTVLTYRKGQSIFSQGDAADAVFFIQKGLVQLKVVSPHGKEAIVAILNQDSFFGEACLASQEARPTTAIAMDSCTLVRIDKRVMVQVLQGEPTFAERFLSYLLSRNIRVQEDLIDQLFHSSEKRLARALLLLADMGKENTGKSVIPKISQETLAEMIGTTRSRVSYFMNRFKTERYIEYNTDFKGGIQVHSSLRNFVQQS